MTMPSSSRCGLLHDQSHGFQFTGYSIYHVRHPRMGGNFGLVQFEPITLNDMASFLLVR